MSKRLVALVLLLALAFSLIQAPKANAFHAVNRGYFYDLSEGGAWWNVWPSWGGSGLCPGDGWAIPGWVGDADSFINYVACKINTGSTQEVIGGLFLVYTMNGGFYDFNEFAARVRYAASRGWINFYATVGCNPGAPPRNTFYQPSRGDVAWYWGCPVNGGGGIATDAITFFNGSDTYILMRFCANPIGNMPALADDVNFNMTAWTTIENQTSPGRGANVYPGDQVLFHHYVRNDGPTYTGTDIWAIAEETVPAYQVLAGWGNFGWYGAGETKNPYNTSLTIPGNAPPGTQYCRTTGYNPINTSGGQARGPWACVTVQYNYSLAPSINVAITGSGGPVAGNIAEPGDSVTFTYAVNNSGTTQSQTATCTYKQATHTGYSTNAPTTSFTPSGANCAPTRTFPVGNTTVASETVANLPINRSVCRSLTVGPPSVGSTLPAGWTSQDIGSPGVAGSTSASGGTFTVNAGGSDIWGASDQFRYTYQSMSGNGEIIARVASLGNTDPWAKAGVMIRNTLAADSNHMLMAFTSGMGTAFQGRTAPNTNMNVAGPATDRWMRLVRSGNTFTAYTSSDGSTWTAVGAPVTLAMNASVYVGLAATSHNNAVTTEAIFDNVTVNGNPITVGSAVPAQACVHVASKPYSRVYGGDISAGGGVATPPDSLNSCTINSGAAIIGWNRRAAGGWSAAGVQFAAYAMSTIFDTADILGNAAPTVSPPSGLSFANSSTNTANGNFGGNLGSVACIKDYYATKPSTTTALVPSTSIDALVSGAYSASGNVRTLGGTVSPGEKISIYISGNFYIDGNITFGGSSAVNDIPMLRVVVQGNIFIDNDVTRLDGLFAAQPNGASGGAIYTCTSATAPGPYAQPTLTGSLLTMCTTKLTVNGSLVAKQILQLRTIGTQRNAAANETAAAGNMAEVFNFSPGNWISQPTGEGGNTYDAITSLPPVL